MQRVAGKKVTGSKLKVAGFKKDQRLETSLTLEGSRLMAQHAKVPLSHS